MEILVEKTKTQGILEKKITYKANFNFIWT